MAKDNSEDMVIFFRSSNHDAEQEALFVDGVLKANNISSVIVGDPVLPLEFRVEVPRDQFERATEAVAEARAAGPDAAAEAEKLSESSTEEPG
jgi:hypothetical protein